MAEANADPSESAAAQHLGYRFQPGEKTVVFSACALITRPLDHGRNNSTVMPRQDCGRALVAAEGGERCCDGGSMV
eukprot:m.478693 g.478693  ORF g.478693 m.478693 type:complete len:76 (-) comp47314_c0_seq1:252-479(-)